MIHTCWRICIPGIYQRTNQCQRSWCAVAPQAPGPTPACYQGYQPWTHQCHQQTSFQTPSCNWNRPLLWVAESSKRRFCVLSFGECWSPSSRLRQSSIINDATSNLCILLCLQFCPNKNKSSGDINRPEKCGWNWDNQGVRGINGVPSGVVPDSPASLTIPRRSLWIRFGVSRCESDRDDVLITGMDGECFWFWPYFFGWFCRSFLSSQVVSRDFQSMMVWWTTFFGADLATIFTQSWSCDVQACISILESWAEGSWKGFQLHRTLGM